MIGRIVVSDDPAPDEPAARRFLIGPAGEGAWIVRDESGVCGAVFSSREDALHFAKEECEALRPQAAHWRFVEAMEWPALFSPGRRKVA